MILNKNKAFTLSETLITLTVVGILAALVIPGLIKDTTNKAMMALLQSTVSNIDANIQSELSKTHSTDMKYSSIFTNPTNFFNNLDAAKTANNNSLFASSYKPISSANIDTPEMTASAMLKNGVAVGVNNEEADEETGVVDSITFYVDANGPKEPNILGVDMFIIPMAMKNDIENGIHVGDLGCTDTASEAGIDSCKSDGSNCYCVLERSGFDSNYLNIKQKTEEEE